MDLIEIHAGSPPERLAQLDELMAETFGFTFAAWRACGGWTDDFTCYALAEPGAILSNAGVYALDLLLCGRRQRVLQIGGVATRCDRRGQGLSKQVLAHILEGFPKQPFFLCANETVLDFYPRFGFRCVPDRQPRLRGPLMDYGIALPGIRRLAVDDPAVGVYLGRCAPLSNILDCSNAGPVQLFHLLQEYPAAIYEIPDLGLMLAAEQRAGMLRLVDVMAARPVPFAQIAPYLQAEFAGAAQIEFGFNPDWLDVPYEMEESGLALFVRGDFRVEGPFKLPEMIIT